eukprot:TRINITY_DN3790_c0_g2_i1.p1 TRINITY_DN3790_c0_g2~~TRINITY_DN3790_c0_g2_i1.p1  ORF type:complete len:523 (-),score=223.39 TRINITY_DN3790_c0_g2_i1:70-1638(-)
MATNNLFQNNIKEEEIIFLNKIGSGSFGEVFEATCHGSTVAVKKMKKKIPTVEDREVFEKEIRKLIEIRHENLCEYYGSIIKEGCCLIITEKLDGNVETKAFDRTTTLPLLEKLKWLEQAAKGMAWLHANNIVHNDFKLTNLLYKNGQVKVCDLGLSLDEEERKSSFSRGAPTFTAPELIDSTIPATLKADLYSFAISAWELLIGGPSHDRLSKEQLFKFVKQGGRPNINAIRNKYTQITQTFLNLIEQCWHQQPEQRPNFEQVIQQLQHIIIEVSIPDSILYSFWTNHFQFNTQIKWSNFYQILHKTFGFFNSVKCDSLLVHDSTFEQLNNASINQLIEFSCRSFENFKLAWPLCKNLNESNNILTLIRLQLLFTIKTNQNDLIVNADHFYKIASCFRPFSLTQFTELCNIVNQPCFHFELNDTQSTRSKLVNNDQFIIRLSSSSPNTLVFASVTPDFSQTQLTRNIDGTISFPLNNSNIETCDSLLTFISKFNLQPAPGSLLSTIIDVVPLSTKYNPLKK